MATKQRCPKCNSLNDVGASQCAYCSAPLVVTCPSCGTSRPWYVPHCSKCEVDSRDERAFSEMFRAAPTSRLGDGYRAESRIAQSPVSAVYVARDASSGDRVVVRELSTVALFRADERRQAEAALQRAIARWSSLTAPHVVRVLDTFRRADRHYVVTEFVDGHTLSQIMADPKLRANPDLVRNWGAQLCDLLIALHGVKPPIHVPFLAPGHVMVDAQGCVKLVSFSLSRLLLPNAPDPWGAVPGYAAPDLREDNPSVQTDLFALGRLLYSLLIDRSLERGLPRRLPLRQAVPGISGQLVKAVARAAHREPARRFASAAELRVLLWADSDVPLEPMADWRERATVAGATRVLPASPAQRRSSGPSMADWGFTQDPRFGANQPETTPVPLPQPVGQARLSVYPHQFDLGALESDGTKRLVLTVKNPGDAELVGRVTSHVGWISAPKSALRLPAQKRARVILSVRSKELASGRTIEPQAISVDTNAGRQWIAAKADIPTGPALRLGSAVLDFGVFEDGAERALSLSFGNTGRQPLSGAVAARVPWLRVPKGEFVCRAGESCQVLVQLLPDRLPQGQQQEAHGLVVDSDGGQAWIEARAWAKRARLDVGTTHMDFGTVRSGDVAERYLYVGNTGDGLLVGTARSLLPFLQVYPQSFECSPGDLVQLTVNVDCAGLADGLLEVPKAVRVHTNAGTRNLTFSVNASAPMLVVKTPHLDFGSVSPGETIERVLSVSNTGSAPFEATIQCLVDWLITPQTSFVCEPDDEVRIAVEASTAGFEPGEAVSVGSALRIVSGSGIHEVSAQVTVVRPALRVDPEEIDFGYVDIARPETRAITIANDGSGSLTWNVQSDAVWLELSPAKGVTPPGQERKTTLKAYGLALESGVKSAEAVVILNSDEGRVKVPVRVALAAPLLATDTSLLDLGVSDNRQPIHGSIRVFNHGLGQLTGTLESDQTWLVLGRASFECDTGRSIEVQVYTDMEEFPEADTMGQGKIVVVSNGGDVEIAVQFSVRLTPDLRAPERVVMTDPGNGRAPKGRLVLRNEGLATAHAEVQASVGSLVPSRERCEVKPGKSVRLTLTWDGPQPTDSEPLYVNVAEGENTLPIPIEWQQPDTGASPRGKEALA